MAITRLTPMIDHIHVLVEVSVFLCLAGHILHDGYVSYFWKMMLSIFKACPNAEVDTVQLTCKILLFTKLAA